MCQDIYCASNTDNVRNYGNSNKTRLVQENTSSRQHGMIVREVNKNWLHPDRPRPTEISVHRIIWPDFIIKKFLTYRKAIADELDTTKTSTAEACNEKYLYHGTAKACTVAEDGALGQGVDLPCTLQTCCMCGILRKSFKLSRTSTATNGNLMFGKGIYVTSCSSKADIHFKDLRSPAVPEKRVVLLNRVVLGNSFQTQHAAQNLKGPPAGYHSVTGVPGTELNYNESVVYAETAVLPVFVIVYSSTPPASLSLFRQPLLPYTVQRSMIAAAPRANNTSPPTRIKGAPRTRRAPPNLILPQYTNPIALFGQAASTSTPAKSQNQGQNQTQKVKKKVGFAGLPAATTPSSSSWIAPHTTPSSSSFYSTGQGFVPGLRRSRSVGNLTTTNIPGNTAKPNNARPKAIYGQSSTIPFRVVGTPAGARAVPQATTPSRSRTQAAPVSMWLQGVPIQTPSIASTTNTNVRTTPRRRRRPRSNST